MRTPWRFVADLVSRRPTADKTDDAARARIDDVKAIAHHPMDEAPPGGPAETIVHDTVDQGGRRPVDDIETSLDTTADGSGIADSTSVALVNEPDMSPAGTVKQPIGDTEDTSNTGEPEIASGGPAGPAEKGVFDPLDADGEGIAPSAEAPSKPRRGKRADRPVVTQVVDELECISEPLVSKTALEEMADRDAEITELRQQLSRKLAEQNEQLRGLLNRYGA